MAKSRSVLVGKVQGAKSVYGVSTGLGGSGTCSHSRFPAPTVFLPCAHLTSLLQLSSRFSHPICAKNIKPACWRRNAADTRTKDTIGLGHALLQHHHTGVLPSVASFQGPLQALPLSDPLAMASMPESWVRGAILVRINSLVRGHSAVRWELLEKMVALLREDITPCVPLRGSISSSGGMSVALISPTCHMTRLCTFFASDLHSRSHPPGIRCWDCCWHP